MLETGSQKMQNATPGNRWSFSSDQCPSGRFPKVSIGITVEKCPKSGPVLRNDDAVVLPPGSKTFSCQGAGKATRPGIRGTLERNKSDDVADHTTSAWFSTRSVHVETPMVETVFCFVNSTLALQSEDGRCKETSTIADGKRKEKVGDVEGVEEVAFATMQEIQFVDKGSAREEPEKTVDFNEKRVNTVTYGKRLEKDGYVERTEKVAFSTKQFLGEENGKEPEVKGKCNNEALRTKLWEILGSVPSENKHTTDSPKIMEYRESLKFTQSRENQKDKVARTKLNSPNLEANKENFNINQRKEYKKGNDVRVKPNSQQLEEKKENFNINQNRGFQKRKTSRTKQNSDIIKTDSESPNQVIRRPITRSFTRKKAPSKRIQKLQDNASHEKKLLSSSSSDFNVRVEEKNVFAFDEVEGEAGSLDRTSSGHSNRSREQSNIKAELRKVQFPRSVSEKIFQKGGKQPSGSPNKASLKSKENKSSFLSSQDQKQFMQMQYGTRNDNHHAQRDEQPNFGSPPQAYNGGTRENTDSPLFKMKSHSWEHENSPPVQKKVFFHEDADRPSVGRENNQLDDFHSPTLATDISPTLPSMPFHNVLSSRVAARPSKSTKRNYNSKGLDKSTPGSCQPDADSEFDDTREAHQEGVVESPVMKDEVHEKKQFSISPMEERDTESEADDHMSQGFGSADKWFHSVGSPTKSPLSLRRTKKIRCINNVKLSKANPSSPFRTDTIRSEETLGSYEALEQLPEGSLGRCVAQLVQVLKRFRRRMKSQADKRSSEILSIAADKIRQQLQDVESQILADVGKFNNIGKSKWKCLESKFKEQHEGLKLIHDRFKEEVKLHLLDCSSILDEFDACNIELKGAAESQKAWHRKLILQVRESTDAHMNNAETSIAAIHKDARKKLIGLKHALKEWME